MALTTSDVKYHIEIEYRRIAEEPSVRATVTAALKYTENKLRSLLGIKSRLAVKDLLPEYSRIIDSYFETLFEKVNRERKRVNRPEYEKLYEAENGNLSIDGADEIERLSWETTARLIVEDEETTDEKPTENITDTESYCECDASYGLSEKEVLFIRLAYNKDYEKMKELAAELGSLTDAVAEKINEAFSDNFGDVILECVDEGYAVIADYREDVENWLTKIVR